MTKPTHRTPMAKTGVLVAQLVTPAGGSEGIDLYFLYDETKDYYDAEGQESISYEPKT